MLEDDDPLTQGKSLVSFVAKPANLLGRETHGTKLLRVQPDESEPTKGQRAVRIADVTAKACRAGIVLHVVIADQGEMGNVERAADVVEEPKLVLGRVLHVVANELHESRPDQVVDLAHGPACDPNVFAPDSVRCRSPGTTTTMGGSVCIGMDESL